MKCQSFFSGKNRKILSNCLMYLHLEWYPRDFGDSKRMADLVLTLKQPITKIVVCFVICL